MAVVVVQPAEFDPGLADRPRQADDLARAFLLHARAIHPRVDVDEEADLAPPPGLDLRGVLDQGGDAPVGVEPRQLAHAPRVGPTTG